VPDENEQPDESTELGAGSNPSLLVRELTGDLPCLGCRYNLRGLSVRSSCPECGIPVRATLLAVVDPHAGELQPIRQPRLMAMGLLVWSGAAALAALCVWLLRLGDLATLFEVTIPSLGRIEDVARRLVPVLVLLSGIGGLAWTNPHPGIPRKQVWMAALAVAAYLPLAVIMWLIHAELDVRAGVRYFGNTPVSVDRLTLRLGADLLMILIAVGLRPSVSMLLARSMLLRSGMTDRQTPNGLIGAVVVAAMGDFLRLLSTHLHNEPTPELVRLCGTLMVGLGSMLLTIGLVLMVIDCVRLRPVVVAPPLSYEDVLGVPPRTPP
jgi:hypothetical protein